VLEVVQGLKKVTAM